MKSVRKVLVFLSIVIFQLTLFSACDFSKDDTRTSRTIVITHHADIPMTFT